MSANTIYKVRYSLYPHEWAMYNVSGRKFLTAYEQNHNNHRYEGKIGGCYVLIQTTSWNKACSIVHNNLGIPMRYIERDFPETIKTAIIDWHVPSYD